MSYRERQRLADIQAAIDAIRSHLQRGDLSDGLIFDAARIRLLEIGEAVKALPRMTCWPRNHLSRGGRSPVCATTSPIGTSIPPTRSCRPPWTKTCPTLARAVRALADSLPDEDPPSDSSHK
jgi:hypothetical protein